MPQKGPWNLNKSRLSSTFYAPTSYYQYSLLSLISHNWACKSGILSCPIYIIKSPTLTITSQPFPQLPWPTLPSGFRRTSLPATPMTSRTTARTSISTPLLPFLPSSPTSSDSLLRRSSLWQAPRRPKPKAVTAKRTSSPASLVDWVSPRLTKPGSSSLRCLFNPTTEHSRRFRGRLRVWSGRRSRRWPESGAGRAEAPFPATEARTGTLVFLRPQRRRLTKTTTPGKSYTLPPDKSQDWR